MDDHTHVYLVGLMGAGKSSVGSVVAAELGLPYLDNDTELARVTGRSTLEWAAEGASALHNTEATYTLGLCTRQDSFVAGIPASVATRQELVEPLRSSGFVVYLRAQPHTLASRVAGDPARPWVGDDPQTVLTQMFVARDAALTALAHDVVDTDDLRSSEVAELVLAALRG